MYGRPSGKRPYSFSNRAGQKVSDPHHIEVLYLITLQFHTSDIYAFTPLPAVQQKFEGEMSWKTMWWFSYWPGGTPLRSWRPERLRRDRTVEALVSLEASGSLFLNEMGLPTGVV